MMQHNDRPNRYGFVVECNSYVTGSRRGKGSVTGVSRDEVSGVEVVLGVVTHHTSQITHHTSHNTSFLRPSLRHELVAGAAMREKENRLVRSGFEVFA